ncbi:MAG: DUF929 family protein [Actinomycetota bacterium]|nr:DUF929 family protein [Actinomycetota bacterium]
MAGVKNGFGARREVPSRLAAGSPGRRRAIYAAAGGLAAVVIAAVALASNLGGKGGPGPAPAQGGPYRPPSAAGTYQLPAGAVSRVEGVPVSALIANAQAQLGRGQVTLPERLPPAAPPLSSGGRPEVMFICAEYWSQCAAERWALVMALSKFGTFDTLKGTTSSATGTSPEIPTFSFYGATYSSKYLSLVTDELETNTDVGEGEYPLLQPPTPQEMTMMKAWDRAPYTTVTLSLPFAYVGGRFLITTAQYDASAISQMSFQAAAASIISSATDPVSRHAEAAAGYLVADFCALTREQPARVCFQVPSSLTRTTASPGT